MARKIYYITKSKGRAGCSNLSYRIADKYESKAELKRDYKWRDATVIKAYYEEEMTDEIRANFARWM